MDFFLIGHRTNIMRNPRPITRSWPLPDELAAVDHDIRKLVATLNPVRAERIRQHREFSLPRTQRIIEAVFERIRAPEIDRPISGDERQSSTTNLAYFNRKRRDISALWACLLRRCLTRPFSKGVYFRAPAIILKLRAKVALSAS